MKTFYLILIIPMPWIMNVIIPIKDSKLYNEVYIDNDSIKWSPDYKLTFNDFQAKEPDKELSKQALKYGIHAGNVFVGISFDVKTEGNKAIIDAFAYIIKSKSWLKSADEKVLKHEQGHFDIAEIYARKFEQAMKQYQNVNDVSYWDKLYKTLSEIHVEHLQEQDNYDETAFTSIGQEFYYKKIQDQLKASQ
jgi:hypothetical protein